MRDLDWEVSRFFFLAFFGFGAFLGGVGGGLVGWGFVEDGRDMSDY